MGLKWTSTRPDRRPSYPAAESFRQPPGAVTNGLARGVASDHAVSYLTGFTGLKSHVRVAPTVAQPGPKGFGQFGGETGFMGINRRRLTLIVLTAALGALALMMVQTASATHVRPKGASPLRASVVPAF